MGTQEKDGTEGILFEEAINLTGFGKYNFYIALVCGLIGSSVLLVALDLSYTIPAAVCDLELISSSKAIMTSAVFLGTISASHLSGLLIDILGRQYVMARSLSLATCLHILTSFAPNFITLAVLKMLIGFVLCSCGIAIFTYIGESCPVAKTSQAVIITSTIGAFAMTYVSGIAWLILPGQWSLDLGYFIVHSWRLFLLLCGVPLLIGTVLMSLLPESPKFLLACGDKKLALEILQNIYSVNSGRSKTDYPVKRLADIPEERVTLAKNFINILRRMWSQTYPLFLPPYLPKVLICSSIYFNSYLCINGILLWVPEMSNRMAYTKSNSPNQTFTLCEMMATVMATSQEFVEPATPYSYFLDSDIPEITTNFTLSESDVTLTASNDCFVEIKEEIFLPNMLMGLVIPISMFLVSFIIPLFQKKVAIMIAFTLAAFLMTLVTLIPNMKLIMTIFTLLPSVISILYNVITCLAVEFFPTNYRGMAVSLCMMFGRLGSILGNFAFSYMLDSNCQTMFYIFVGFLISGLLITLLIKPQKPKSSTEKEL